MYRQSILNTLSKSRWSLAAALIAILMITQAAYAIGVRFIFIHAPSQLVDLDGDGDRETFSAEMTVYEDGTAGGEVHIADQYLIVPFAGEALCRDGNPVASVRGTAYQAVDDVLLELGTFVVEAQPASSHGGGNGGGGGDIILYDIIAGLHDGESSRNSKPAGPIWDIVDDDVSEVAGTLDFAADPCAAASSG